MGNKEYRAKKRGQGLCYDCLSPALPGHTRCEKHMAISACAAMKSKVTRWKEGRCFTCGRELIEDGWHNCPLCRDHYFGGMIWR